MEKRFVLFYIKEGKDDWGWFESEEEMRDFLSYYDSDELLVVEAIEILNCREIGIAD